MLEFAVAISVASLLLLPLYVFGLYGIVAYFRKRSNPSGGVNWTPSEAIGVTVATYFISQLVAGLFVGLYLAIQNKSADEIGTLLETSIGFQFAFVLLVEGVTVALIVWFMRRRSTLLSKIGLVKVRVLRDVGYALAGFVAYFALYLVLLQLVQLVAPGINTDQKQELGFSTDTSGIGLLLVFVSLVILPPVVEEILTRGFLYTGLRTKLNVIWAGLITSAVFGFAHLQFGSGQPLLYVAAIDTFTLSVVLVYLREKTGSLWPPIGLHMLKNGVAFVALFVLHLA